MNHRSKLLALFMVLAFVFVLSGIAQQQGDETVTCPVSGKVMKKSEVKVTAEYQGKTYYFCCENCKEKFLKDPEQYLQKKEEVKTVYTCPMHPDVKSDKPGKCPKCNMELKPMTMPQGKMEGCQGMMGGMHREGWMRMMGRMHGHGSMQRHGWMMHMKTEGMGCPLCSPDVEMSVENLSDGVAIKFTTKNAEMAKKIQEHVAQMKTMREECKETCKKEEVKKEEVKK
jgi:YHS domain-containing protein